MLAMIRINLLGAPAQKGGKRKRRTASLPDVPNLGILIFVLLLVMEFAALYTWHAEASERATSLGTRLRRAKTELDAAKRVAADMAVLQKDIQELEKVSLLFEELDGEKRGPLGAFTFLSFMLKVRDPKVVPTSELKLLEASGWRTRWEANRAWFTSIREAEGEVTLMGEAMNHEDVAEVLRRLESSAHFRNVQLAFNEKRKDGRLDLEIVQFTIKATLIYLVEPYLSPEQRQAKLEAAEMAGEATAIGDAGADGSGLRLPSDRAPPTELDARDINALAVDPSPTADAESPTPTAASGVDAAVPPSGGATPTQGSAPAAPTPPTPLVPTPARGAP